MADFDTDSVPDTDEVRSPERIINLSATVVSLENVRHLGTDRSGLSITVNFRVCES